MADAPPLRDQLRDAFDAARTVSEQKCLGWLMYAGDLNAARATANDLEPWDFIEPLHGKIFSAVRSTLRDGQQPSLSELTLALADCSALLEVNGTEYLQHLFCMAPAVFDGRPLAFAVRAMSARYRAAPELRSLAEDALRTAVPIAETMRRLTEVQTVLSQVGDNVISATPYVWREPGLIPHRQSLFESRHAHIGTVSLTTGPGGIGKSSLIMVEQLAHVTGRNLLNDQPLMRGHAWHIALEDDRDEHERRLAAEIRHHKIEPALLAGRFFLDIPEDFAIARVERDGVVVVVPLVDSLIREVKKHGITYLSIDPLVACHRVSENDNLAVNEVVRSWAKVAREGQCAVELCHHNRKSTGAAEQSADDFRGAVALREACRSMRMLRRMTAKEGDEFGISEPRRFFCVVDSKKNMSAYNEALQWRELVVVDLGNGSEAGPSDKVAAVAAWEPQTGDSSINDVDLAAIKEKIAAGSWRLDQRAKDWVGRAIATARVIDIADPAGLRLVKAILMSLIASGELRVVEKTTEDRKLRKFVEVVD